MDQIRTNSVHLESLSRSLPRAVLYQTLDTLDFLRSPPGNHLEALRDNRRGQHSIRVNDQFRVCFRWTKEGPADVEIVDYH